MNVFAVGGLVVAALYVAVAALVLLHPLAGKPYPADLPPARPGRDDQWAAFRDTVPNIRKDVLAEQAVELAFHPASLDAPVPARFLDRFPLRSPGSLFAHDTPSGRHRRPDSAEPIR